MNRMPILCMFLVMTSLPLAAMEPFDEDEMFARFGRRLIAALRVPESPTNIGELVPTEQQIWDAAEPVKMAGDVKFRRIGEHLISRQSVSRQQILDALTKGLKELRQFVMQYDIDVTQETTFKVVEIQRGKCFLLRYPDCDLLLRCSNEMIDGRVYALDVAPCAIIQCKDRRVELIAWHEAKRPNTRPGILNMFDEKAQIEFSAGFASDRLASRETGLLIYDSLARIQYDDRSVLNETALQGFDAAGTVALYVDGKLGALWTKGVLESDPTLSLKRLTCRRIDPSLLEARANAQKEREIWAGARAMTADERQQIRVLLDGFRDAVAKEGFSPKAVAKLVCKENRSSFEELDEKAYHGFREALSGPFDPKEETRLILNMIELAGKQDALWFRAGARARVDVSSDQNKKFMKIECIMEDGVWRLVDFSGFGD